MLLALLLVASTAAGQTGPPTTPATQTAPGDNVLRLTRDEAVRLAVENNPDLAVSRYDPAISHQRVDAAKAAFIPTLQSGIQRNKQLQPPTSLFAETAGLETGTWSANTSVIQLMPWGGGNYQVGIDTSRVTTNSLISSFNPSTTARLNVAFSQPLWRDFAIDFTRAQVDIAIRNQSIADVRMLEDTVNTTADAERSVLVARRRERTGGRAAARTRSRTGTGAHEPSAGRCGAIAAPRPRRRSRGSCAAD